MARCALTALRGGVMASPLEQWGAEYEKQHPNGPKLQRRAACICERDLAKEITMQVVVHVKRDWRVRLGIWLLKVGCWVSGMGIEVEDE